MQAKPEAVTKNHIRTNRGQKPQEQAFSACFLGSSAADSTTRSRSRISILQVDSGSRKNTLLRLTKEGRQPCRFGVIQSRWRGSERVLTEIKLKKGEPVEKALRRLKKKIDREGTLKVVRNHRHFEKPSEKRRRKEKAARFSAMLSARYADM
jgi:small subunit ribosomal protein S21